MAARLGWAAVSLAGAILLLGLAIAPFLTPAWIHLEQDRSGAAALTGFDTPTLDRVTDSIVHDLLLGGGFDVTAPAAGCAAGAGCPQVAVLDAREVTHMQDVRGVFDGLALLVILAVAVLFVAEARGRRSAAARAALWRAVGRGGRWLTVFMAIVAVLSVVAFDAAFQAFHELLFPAGSFTFDPRTERLVQLFPDQFWSDTALAFGLVTLVLSLAVAWLAGRRAAVLGRLADRSAPGAPQPAPATGRTAS